jgi:hypothetical protein
MLLPGMGMRAYLFRRGKKEERKKKRERRRRKNEERKKKGAIAPFCFFKLEF